MINVSNIERFATHDGPGIRTTIFLQGCSLHCPWCANPETWTSYPVLMHDVTKCIHCHHCQSICEKKAITFPFHWDEKKCSECHRCENECLEEAISFSSQAMEIEEVVQEVLKDKDYYNQSKGGITISGGEPFYQFEEFLRLIKAIKKEELHLAVETTGNYPLEKLKQALPYIDLFLFDCKHLDKEKLQKVTGGNLDFILNNLAYLSKHCPNRVIVRMPVIPFFNEELCTNVIDFTKEYGLKEMHLLPFHSLGKKKWDQVQRNYLYKEQTMMKKEELLKYIEYGQEQGILVKIGG